MKRKLIVIIIATLLFSCGTSPWFINKKLYSVYKNPISTTPKHNISTDGYYIIASDTVKPYLDRNILLFDNYGYCTSLTQEELDNYILKQTPITKDLDWYLVENDSLLIENYSDFKRQMYSSVWWHKGLILNDSTITVQYFDNNYSKEQIKYKFIKKIDIPCLMNRAPYSKKKWYKSKLHQTRKKQISTI